MVSEVANSLKLTLISYVHHSTRLLKHNQKITPLFLAMQRLEEIGGFDVFFLLLTARRYMYVLIGDSKVLIGFTCIFEVTQQPKVQLRSNEKQLKEESGIFM